MVQPKYVISQHKGAYRNSKVDQIEFTGLIDSDVLM